MRNILISTLGTSLIGNISYSDNTDLKKLFETKNAKGLAVELCKILPDDRLCGAEINSINSIVEKGYLGKKSVLKMLTSDTENGRFIGEVLSSYFKSSKNKNRFENVDYEVVEGLTDEDVTSFKSNGLKNLVRLICETVRKHDSGHILINATGGYKAQISFAGMIGQALEIPVCYMFERFAEVIELPPQPVSFDLSLWLDNAEIFYDLDDGIETDKILDLPDKRFDSLVEDIQEGKEHLYALSPAGLLFHESFRYRFSQQASAVLPKTSPIPVEKKKIKYEDDNKGKHAGLENYLDKIKTVPYVDAIYTHYYNPDLTRPNRFRKSSKGTENQLEGWFSSAGALTKFDIITTAETSRELHACIADLNERFDQGKSWR